MEPTNKPRLEALFVAGDAKTEHGLLSVSDSWFQGVAIPALPSPQTMFAVVVFDLELIQPEGVEFILLDPDGTDVPVTASPVPPIDLQADSRLIFVYSRIGFELTMEGRHKLYAVLDHDIMDSRSYPLDVKLDPNMQRPPPSPTPSVGGRPRKPPKPRKRNPKRR